MVTVVTTAQAVVIRRAAIGDARRSQRPLRCECSTRVSCPLGPRIYVARSRSRDWLVVFERKCAVGLRTRHWRERRRCCCELASGAAQVSESGTARSERARTCNQWARAWSRRYIRSTTSAKSTLGNRRRANASEHILASSRRRLSRELQTLTCRKCLPGPCAHMANRAPQHDCTSR